MLKHIQSFLNDESGPTAVEYAVVLGGIIFVVFAAVATIGTATYDSYVESKNQMESAGVK